ncbi:MAG TPA: hypothetical protein VFM63_01660 [Pyrinomonadaceae bacterium]|nr:hypothetical protein [Pyrinomonadaceae bacterium]
MTRREPPSEEAFNKLLAWLDPDSDKAVEKYQRIQFRLIKIFAAKGHVDPETLADEAVNAVCLKIDWLLANYSGNPALFFFGVAKKIHLEQIPKNTPQIPPPPDNSEIEAGCWCLEKCLKTAVSADDGSCVLRYHEGRGQQRIQNRKLLADEMGISINALRIRVFHIQARLRPCVEDCLEKMAA